MTEIEDAVERLTRSLRACEDMRDAALDRAESAESKLSVLEGAGRRVIGEAEHGAVFMHDLIAFKAALQEIAEHPGPNADDMAHMKAEIAKDALASLDRTVPAEEEVDINELAYAMEDFAYSEDLPAEGEGKAQRAANNVIQHFVEKVVPYVSLNQERRDHAENELRAAVLVEIAALSQPPDTGGLDARRERYARIIAQELGEEWELVRPGPDFETAPSQDDYLRAAAAILNSEGAAS